MVVVAQATQTMDLGFLPFDLFLRIVFAGASEIGDAHVFSVESGFAHLHFDRQAMRVPSENERGFETAHVLVTDREILQKTVEHMAAMNVSVGVWRTIMKKVFLTSSAVFIHLLVEFLRIPSLDEKRFFLVEVTSHLKTGLRHQQGVFQSHTLCSFWGNKSAPELPKGASMRGTTLFRRNALRSRCPITPGWRLP